MRYIAVVITLGDWFQTEYSVYNEHGKIEQNRNRDFSFRIEIDRLAKISYRHSTIGGYVELSESVVHVTDIQAVSAS